MTNDFKSKQSSGARPPRLSPEEYAAKKKAEKEAIYQLLDNTASEVVQSPEKFKAYLDVQSRMDRYTANNALLMYKQFPQASQIKEFDDWAAEGVKVNKGSKTFIILDPYEYTKKDGTIGIDFNLKRVLDVSQTNGKRPAAPTANRDPRKLVAVMLDSAPINIESTNELPYPDMGAFYKNEDQTLYVKRDIGDSVALCQCVAQELGHAELSMNSEVYSRRDMGFQAVCIGYMLCKKYGVDTQNFAIDRIPDELKNAGLKEKGQLSGVIKSSVGFLIVRLDDIQPAKVKSLDEVRDDIAAKVKHEKALDAYYALQQKVSDAASNDTESLAGAEQAAGVKATQTGWFSKDNLPEELNFKPVADAIFNGGLVGENGAPGINSDIITVDGDRAFVLRISEHKPEAVKPLADVQEQVKALVQHNKAEQQAKVDAEKLLVDLKAGKGAEAMQAAGLKFGEPKTLSRSGRDPISQAAFALPLPAKDKPSYGMATDMQGNVVLLALDEVKQGSMPEDQKKAMVQGITQNNAQIVFEALMSNLRKEAKIKIGDALEQQ